MIRLLMALSYLGMLLLAKSTATGRLATCEMVETQSTNAVLITALFRVNSLFLYPNLLYIKSN